MDRTSEPEELGSAEPEDGDMLQDVCALIAIMVFVIGTYLLLGRLAE